MDLGFHLIIRGVKSSGQRVVLMHGWLQSSDVWLLTARHLADRFGHEVLVLDWWGHGRSPIPDTTGSCSGVEGLEKELVDILNYYGWLDKGAPALALAGISLGGGIALRFTSHYPDKISRLTLVCSAGLSEKWWALPSLTAPLRATALALGNFGFESLPFLNRLFWLVRLVETTPTYGVPSDMPELLAAYEVPLSLLWGQLDWVHTAQIDRWRAGRSESEVPARLFPLKGHVALATRIDELKLWESPELWSNRITPMAPKPFESATKGPGSSHGDVGYSDAQHKLMAVEKTSLELPLSRL